MTANEPESTATDFEDNLLALESLVERLEQGDIPLAAAMQAYEEGLKRAQVCESLLAAAQKKIEELGGTGDDAAESGAG